MATELGSAFISVGLGTNSLAGDIKKAFGASGDVGESAGKEAGSRFGGAVGLAAAAVGALGIGSFFKSAISGAGDLQQSVGAIDSVFKGSAGQMHDWAKSAATDVGLSSNEFNELGTLIGSQLKNGGTAMDELAPKTQSLISTGADLASMFGGTTSEAVSALSSALKGERDPIERYGVSLNQAKIDAEAAALGFEKVDGALSAEANQAATLSLIMKQTADAHGNFASESDTLAHKQQVLNAQLANGKARIGTELLPVISALTGALSKALGPAIDIAVAGIHNMVGAGQGLYDLFIKGDFTGALADAFNLEEDSKAVDVMFRIRDAAIGLHALITSGDYTGALGRAFNLEEDSPIIDKMLRIRDGFVGVFDIVTKGDYTGAFGRAFHLEEDSPIVDFLLNLRDSIGQVLPNLITLASAFSPMQIIFAAIEPLLPQLGDMFLQLATVLGGSLLTILTALTPMFVQLSGVVSEALGGVIAAVLPTVVTMITMLGATLAELIPIIVPIITTLVQLATTLISQLMPIIMDLVASILPPLVDIFGNILSAIGPVITMVAGLLIPIIMALMPVVVTVFSVVADVIKNAMQIVQGIIQVVTGIISGDWGQVWEGIGNIFGGIWNTIVSVVQGAIKIVGSVISAGMGLVLGFVSDALGNIGRFFSDTWSNIVNGVSGMIGNVLGFFGDLGGKIVGAMGNIGSTLFNTGKNIIQGLIDGIGSMMGAIGRAVLSIVPEAIRGPFEDLLGIHSPSRVFREYGVNIGQGLILGIDGMHGKVANSVTGLVNVPAAPNFSAGSYTPVSAGVGAAGSGVSIGTVHVRDENEMARLILNKQRDAQAAYGF